MLFSQRVSSASMRRCWALSLVLFCIEDNDKAGILGGGVGKKVASSVPLCPLWLSLGFFPLRSTLFHKIHFGFVRNYAGLVAHIEQAPDGFAAILAVIECALVYIHADEPVGGRRVEVAGKLHGIGKSFFAMLQRVLDAVAKSVGDGRHQVCAQAAA